MAKVPPFCEFDDPQKRLENIEKLAADIYNMPAGEQFTGPFMAATAQALYSIAQELREIRELLGWKL